MRTRIFSRGRKTLYLGRLVAAAAVGSLLAAVGGYAGAGAQNIQLSGSPAIAASWVRQAPARGQIRPATARDVKVALSHRARAASEADAALTARTAPVGNPPVSSPWEWLSGTAAGQNFTSPGNVDGGSLGGTLLDVNVAASHTHVCVTARAALACYNKAGELVSLGHGLAPQVETAATFFTQAGISLEPAFDGSQNQVKDGRVIFDQHTDRFYMFFQERGTTPRLLIAVSRAEDPTDGWYAFADVTTQTGTPNGTLNGHDYDFIGLNENYLLADSDMVPCAPNASNQWTCNNGKRILVHFIYSLSQLAAGQLTSRGSWYDSSGQNIWAAAVADQGGDPNAYWIARTGAQTATVYQLNPQGFVNWATAALPNTSNSYGGTSASSPANEPGGGVLEYGIIGPAYRNAGKLGTFIVAASDDGLTWPGQTTSSNVVRLDEFNISGTVFNNSTTPAITVTKDRIFGLSSSGDPAGSLFDYGDPGVAIAGNGDVGVGELRSNPANYPQLRGSVWVSGASDISPSAPLFNSTGGLGSIHMSGAAVDPSSSNGLYFAQVVGEAPTVTCAPSNLQCGAQIGVAKVDGTLQPDLIATSLAGPASVLLPTQTAQVSVTVLNQGDGAAPATTGQLYLSQSGTGLINPASDQDVAQFNIPALAAGQSATVPVSFQTPNIACQCVVGAVIGEAGNEYSATNNINPYLDGLHGNIPLTLNPIVNGAFATGDLTGWTPTGTAAVVPEGFGPDGARLGAASPTNGDSTVSQTFLAPTNTSKVGFVYQNTCPDTLAFDWATATLTDHTTNTTTTILAKTCTATPNFTFVSAPILANHTYTITLVNHDDNFPSDPTYTDYTSVAVS
jgi:hypothetical protein